MPTRSKAQIQIDIKAWLEARLRTVDTGAKTVLSALVLEGFATALANANADLATAQAAQGLGSTDTIAKEDLDDLAYNLNLTRKSATKSTGFITFRRTTVPTQTIRIGNEDGTGGVLVGTGRDASGAFVSFETTQTVFFTTSTSADPVSNLYEVSAPIRAITPGTTGNKSAGTVTGLLTPVSGVTSVTNKVATTGGKDEESNEDFAARLGAKLMGFQPGILEGLRTVAMGQDGVEDASVVGPDDSEFQRSAIGAVDVVIKGSAETTAVDTFTYPGPTAYVLTSRPVTDITQVISTVGLTQSALTEGAQWSFSQDTVTEQRLSVDSNDHLSWLGTSLPNANADVQVTYKYDELIDSIQDVLDLESRRYPAAVPLVKRGTAVSIDIAFTVRRDSTIDSTSLRNNLSTELTEYVASLGLGSTIKQSDLIAVIKSVSGVSRVTTPFTTLCRRSSSGVADVSLTKYEYPQLDSSSLTITVTS